MRKTIQITGALLGMMGLVTLVGWWAHVEMLVRLIPGAIAMTPNTALCFILTGAAIALGSGNTARVRMAQLGLAFIVFAIASLTLAQFVFNFDTGTDRLLAHIWLVDSNIHPGRMAPQTTIGFITASTIIALLNSRFNMFKDSIIHVLLILLGAVGVIGMMGYAFDLSLLYSWYQKTAIAAHTAIGFILITVGLWAMWLAQRYRYHAQITASVQPLGLFAFTMVIITILGSGLFGFIAMVTQTEQLQRTHLENIVRLQTRQIKSELDASNALSAPIANRPFMNQQINAFNQGTGGDAAVRAIALDAKSFISNNITGLSIHGLTGQLITQAGSIQNKTEFTAALDYQRKLLWNGGLFLQRSMNLIQDGQPIGTALVEIRLPGIEDILRASAYVGASAESVICISDTPSTLQCLPSRHRPTVFNVVRSPNGRTLPMEFALDRAAGVITTRDYRQIEVMAAYNHLTPYPLGIVTKVDTAEMYAPIRRLFQIYFVLLTVFIVLIAVAHRLGKHGTPAVE